LNTMSETARKVLQELIGAVRSTVARVPRRNDLGIGANRGPGPHVAHVELALLVERDILCFGVAEGPDFIDLNTTARKVAEGAVLVLGAGLTKVYQELRHGVDRASDHAGRGAKA